MRLQHLLLSFSLLLSGISFAQQATNLTYTTSRKTNLIYSGIGVGTALTGFGFERSVEAYTLEQIQSLKTPKLSGLDHKSTRWYNSQFEKASDVLGVTSIAMPMLLLISNRTHNQREQLLFQWAQVTSLTWGITSLTKSLTLRDRPFLFNSDVSMEKKLKKDARLSFFSGHTSISAASWFFFAQNVHVYSQKKWVKTLTWMGAFIVPALTGYSRMRAGKHYFTDVATGYLLGGSIGFFIPKIHARIAQKNRLTKLN